MRAEQQTKKVSSPEVVSLRSKPRKQVSDAIMFDVIDSMIPSLAKQYREQFGAQEKKAA